MSHEEKIVYDLINDRKDKYGRYHKCIFHMHTPASYDYKLFEDGTYYYDSVTDEEIFKIAQEVNLIANEQQIELLCTYDEILYDSLKEYVVFLIIAKKLIDNGIEAVLIADHNTFNGYEKLKDSIKKVYKSSDKCYPEVLLGAEISCADRNHVVVIFNEKSYGIAKKFFDSILIDEKSGTYYTSLQVIEETNKLNGYAYIAHINSSDVLKPNLFSGGYKKELFNNKNLKILGVSNKEEVTIIKNRIQAITKRDFDFILDNDSHGIDTLTRNTFWVKGSKISFSTIKDIYKDYDITISLDEPYEPNNYIKGIVIKNSNTGFLCSKEHFDDKKDPYLVIPFSNALNCIIGGRGSGKSSIINILQFILSQTIASEDNLEMICSYEKIWILCKNKDREYIIEFSSPVKEYTDDSILKYFDESMYGTSIYRERYYFRPEKIKQCAIKKYIKIFEVTNNADKIEFKEYNKVKTSLLNRLFRNAYSVNQLVSMSFSDTQLSGFIFDFIYKDKKSTLERKIASILKEKDTKKKVNRASKLEIEKNRLFNEILDRYNEKNRKSLKIEYTQEYDLLNIRRIINGAFENVDGYITIKGKTYNILLESFIRTIINKIANIGIFEFLGILEANKLDIIINDIDVENQKEALTKKEIEKGISTLKKDENNKFLRDAFEKIYAIKTNIINNALDSALSNIGMFSLYFNLNSNQNGQRENYKNVKVLSLGQKVVALLTFILSYSEFSNDNTPLIIDQPEDNLDSQYIYNNLVKQLRKTKEMRQIIIATHNSTIVTNSKTENVIVMKSNNENGWMETYGYPSEKAIINQILKYLEGGKESFNHKKIIYEEYL